MGKGLLGLKPEPDREKRQVADEDYSQATNLEPIKPGETEEEQRQHLKMVVKFVNSLRESGSNAGRGKSKPPPSKEKRLIQFLATYCPSAFTPISKEEADIFHQRTGNPPSSFTDSQSWIKSEQHRNFVTDVWQVYSEELEELVNNQEKSFLKLWHPSRLWQQYQSGDQLVFDNPTYRFLGHPQSTTSEMQRDEILLGLESGADGRFGFDCLGLLLNLCSGFYYAVRWMKAEGDRFNEATKKGLLKPKRKELFRKCRASEAVKGVKVRRKCEQIVLVDKLDSGKRGRKFRHCSSACRSRQKRREE